ncbi:hypothetical protein AAG570_002849 [Ranatra chinensis]|uniref:Nucleotidyl transferase domain-containing protein n=1 Tax=Ranatra chinensis TaxID=642074 RepID=A0ABD0YN20_9HEMI
MIQHHIEACAKVPDLKEILILGYYLAAELAQFVSEMIQKYNVNIRYLQEFTALGTAGGMYHFRDQIRSGNPEGFFVLNGDVCADFPLEDILEYNRSKIAAGSSPLITVMATETTRQQALNYGCIVMDQLSGHITHYVEKPSTFVSTLVNCGVYFCSPELFQTMATVFNMKQSNFYNEHCYSGSNDPINKDSEAIQLEQDVMMPLAGTGRAFVFPTARWWSQVKSAGAAVYANRQYLQLYRKTHPERLAKNTDAVIIGDVHIHPTAVVDRTAVLGPNVSIGAEATIGPGVRLRDTLVLASASVGEHSLVAHSIVGRSVRIGSWARVEGTPCDPNPNKPFAKMDNLPLFNNDGRLNPSITILGCSVKVPSEVILLNSIVLPNKELTRSFKYEIIL